MDFFIVILTSGAASCIDSSLGSILLQECDFSLHVHVQDAGTSDATVHIVQGWQRWVEAKPERKIRLTWASEPNNGFYDGLMRATDADPKPDETIMTWLRSGDVILPGALSTVQSILSEHPEVQWMTGLNFVADGDGSNRTLSPLKNFGRFCLSQAIMSIAALAPFQK